jgi:peptide/nickel transport system substrate-binding protein
MHRRLLLASGLAVVGASLFVAAAFAGTTGPAQSSQSAVSKGGTLRLNYSASDYEYLDPALAYDSYGWATLYAVNMMLLNYPDKPASAGGNQLVPEGATGFPTVSKDGKTYVFTIRSGQKFSDGSNVTAAAFARSITRVCHPDQASPAVAFANNIAGCVAFNQKKGNLTGVRAAGQKLTVRLIQPDPTFLAQIAMPFFAAVKPNMPINAKGENVYPSAGPYRIVSREPGRSLVLERNKQYKGTRPANPDRIVVTTNTDQNQSLLQVRAGEADHDLASVPAVANAQLADEFGVNKARYFVNPLVGTGYIALNTSRPTFSNVKARQAANYAADRPALLRTRGKFGGKRTDQILAPQLPGFKAASLYPLTGAQPAKAKSIWGQGGEVNFLHSTTAASVAQAQIFKYNLEQAGFKVNLKPQPFGVAINTMGTKGNEMDAFSIGWIADYFDPFDFINVLLDGTTIQDKNNSNYAYFNSAKYNRLMKAAAKLTGQARYTAYGNLDVDIMKNAAPWVPIFNYTSRDFISARVENFIFHPVYGHAIINALAIKK